MSDKIAGCIVLYRPSPKVIDNIKTYYPYLDLLIAVDNSEVVDADIKSLLQENFPNVVYHPAGGNLGIAAALNIGCRAAIEVNAKWILTMDQDSSFIGTDMQTMIADIPVLTHLFLKPGIITPFHILATGISKHHKVHFTERKIAMTSGNLLNITAYQVCGTFDESLFMDYVDYEYCLRLRKNGYSIVQDNQVNLKHSLGNFTLKRLLGQRLGVSNHNPQRRYYMTRNSLITGTRHYKTDWHFFYRTLLNNFLLDPFIILLYEKNKRAKMVSTAKGVLHFILGKRGRIDVIKV